MTNTIRAAFERYVMREIGEQGDVSATDFMGRNAEGDYTYGMTDFNWRMWQASRAQPERVALSDAEIESLVEWMGDPHDPYFDRIKFARAILAAQPITQPLIAEAARDDAMAALRKLHVGDSSFDGWFAEKDMRGLGTKQLCRDAYAAGMEDPEMAQLIVNIKRDDVAGDASLLHALKEVRACLDRVNENESAIVDTIWYSDHETLFDYIDAAIAASTKAAQ